MTELNEWMEKIKPDEYNQIIKFIDDTKNKKNYLINYYFYMEIYIKELN